MLGAQLVVLCVVPLRIGECVCVRCSLTMMCLCRVGDRARVCAVYVVYTLAAVCSLFCRELTPSAAE